MGMGMQYDIFVQYNVIVSDNYRHTSKVAITNVKNV